MSLWLRLIWAYLSWRRRGPLELFSVGTRSFRVWPSDLDTFAHMNNGKFLTLLDLGRLDLFLRNRFWQKMKAKHWYPVVVAETITFRKSLVLGQKFEMETRVIGWDVISYFIEQRFVVAGEIYAKAIVRGRFLSKSGKVLKPHDVMLAVTGSDEPSPKLEKWILDWAETTSLPRGKEAAPSVWL